MKIKYLIIAFCIPLLTACGDNGSQPEPPPIDEGYVAPEPPAAINDYNLFTVEFYSKLNNESLFGESSYDEVINHIDSEKKTLYFLFDMVEAIPGKPSPIVDIAWKTKSVPFFAQNNAGTGTIKGTGIITRQLVNIYPGIYASNSLFVAGCNVSVPLYQTNRLSLMTCKIEGESQFGLLVERKIAGAEPNQIVIGTIAAGLENDFKEYLKYNLTNFRIAITSSVQSGKTHKLFILSPVKFVMRETKETSVGNIPVYQCKIEYLE